MIISNIENFSEMNLVKAKVELYNGSTLVTTCTCSDVLSDFSISREGEVGKFFGFGICHKLDMNLIDLYKVIKLYEGYTAKICFGDGTIFDCPYPQLTITNVSVDKKSGDIKVTAYDIIYKATELTYSDLNINAPYNLRSLATACAAVLGVSIIGVDGSAFDLAYPEGGNYVGDESIRQILNEIAEVTQTIYYINKDNELTFRKISDVSVADYYERDYYEFETAESKTLNAIGSTTELGDNYLATNEEIIDGVAQYIRDNRLLELRADIADLLDAAVAGLSGKPVHQFDLDWSGDYRLEVGDVVTIHYEDEAIELVVLNDIINYAGTLNEQTSWQYKESENDSFTNPTNITEKINQTFAKVDKAAQRIELVVSNVEQYDDRIEAAESQITSLELTTNGLNASVTKVENNLSEKIDNVAHDVEKLTSSVDAAITAEEVEIIIKQEIENGVDKVVTSEKKYTLDDTGLNISDPDSDISTKIDNDGMTISTTQLGEVLDINNTGVQAQNLHATTYLHIGTSSRFEDWTDPETYEARTACFWMGGLNG